MTDAIRGCGSAPGMKREIVLCATEWPAKASVTIVERMVFKVIESSWETSVIQKVELQRGYLRNYLRSKQTSVKRMIYMQILLPRGMAKRKYEIFGLA
jgi:hypothetical protein